MAKKNTVNYFKLYEKLYRLGYHSKLKNHGQKYANYLMNEFTFRDILDIGCSNGMAVLKFFKRRKRAYGIDASEIAIRYAAEKAFVPNCILASATDIPFIDRFVDAIFSCDVFEHLTEKDVHKAISEVYRVTKNFFFIVLDCELERNRDWLQKAKEEYPEDFRYIDNLHLTVWTESTWKKTIESYGFKFIKNEGNLYCFKKV